MSWQATNWAVQQKTGGPGPKTILLLLADRADEMHSAFPSQETLARESEQSVSTVRRQLKALEERGLISRQKRGSGAGGRTSDRIVLAVTGQIDRMVVTGQKEGVTGQIEGGYRSPVNEEPPVEPPLEEPNTPDADAPGGELVLEGMPAAEKPQPSAGDLVKAWCDGWSEVRGGTPDPSVVRRVAGSCRQVAKTRTDRESWVTAWHAAKAAGAEGRYDVVAALAGYRPAARPARAGSAAAVDWQSNLDWAREHDGAAS